MCDYPSRAEGGKRFENDSKLENTIQKCVRRGDGWTFCVQWISGDLGKTTGVGCKHESVVNCRQPRGVFFFFAMATPVQYTGNKWPRRTINAQRAAAAAVCSRRRRWRVKRTSENGTAADTRTRNAVRW